MRLASRVQLFCLVALATAILAGCGSDRPKTVPVKGRITLNGGDWPTSGRLYFTTLEPAEGFPRRPGRADFDAAGNFVAQTWERGDGLMPGKYKVHAECWQSPPSMEGPPAASHVPEKYQSAARSDLELLIPVDSRGEKVEFDMR